MSSSELAREILHDLTIGAPFSILDMASEIQIALNQKESLDNIRNKYIFEKTEHINQGMVILQSDSAQEKYLIETSEALDRALYQFRRTNSGYDSITKLMTETILRDLSGQIVDHLKKEKSNFEELVDEDEINEKEIHLKLNSRQLAHAFIHFKKVYPSCDKTQIANGLAMFLPNDSESIRKKLSNPDKIRQNDLDSLIEFMENWINSIKHNRTKLFPE